MIPGSFDYHRPATLSEAAGMLASLGESARVLAGGHSLIPVMKLRMSDLAHLVDLQDCAEIRGVRLEGDTAVIGAMTTQHALIADAALAARLPLIHEAALQIADPQVRYVGTIGGNVANGDPANDMPGLMQCLDASFEISNAASVRTVRARDFYHGAYDTELADGDILARIHVPLPGPHGAAYEKQKRKIGDYATAAAAVMLTLDGGAVSGASIAMTNLADRPIFAAEAGAALVGRPVAEGIDAAVEAAKAAIAPVDDNRGPADFKRHVAGVMLRRAILRAADRAEAAS